MIHDWNKKRNKGRKNDKKKKNKQTKESKERKKKKTERNKIAIKKERKNHKEDKGRGKEASLAHGRPIKDRQTFAYYMKERK